MRYSRQREAIYQALKSTKSHPDAEWVYCKVRQTIPDISLGTVYRNLRQLADSGEVTIIETEDKSMHFDADTSPHLHFVCSECGSIKDLFMDSGMLPKLNDMGFMAKTEKAVYYGVCNDCLKK